jgi:4-hydroxy-tetrahydrodipicolinate synthase
MYEEGNPVGVKHVMSLLELCQPFVRLPLVPASFALQKKIEKFYEEIKK